MLHVSAVLHRNAETAGLMNRVALLGNSDKCPCCWDSVKHCAARGIFNKRYNRKVRERVSSCRLCHSLRRPSCCFQMLWPGSATGPPKRWSANMPAPLPAGSSKDSKAVGGRQKQSSFEPRSLSEVRGGSSFHWLCLELLSAMGGLGS